MSLNNFIPEVWSANLLSALEKAHVTASVANREFEGEIKGAGSRVRINQIGDISVKAYTKDSNIEEPETLTDAQSWLDLDQQKYFNFQIDDIDVAQQNPKIMQEAVRRAGYKLRDTADSYILGLYAQAGLSLYSNTTPADVTSLNVEGIIAEIAEKMNDNNFPVNGRFAVIPPWFYTKLWLAGLTTKSANDVLYENGRVGLVNNIDFLMSNNISKNSTGWDKSRIICGIKNESLWYAENISVEAYRMEKRFADAVKGLHVYGAKWRTDETIVLYADKTAEA